MKRSNHAFIFLLFSSLAFACDKDNGDSGGESAGSGENEETRVRTASDGLYTNRGLSPQVVTMRNLRGMFDSAFTYQSGDYAEGHFPSSVGRTPAVIPCGEAVAVNPADWQHPTWRALRFLPASPIRYSYQFDNIRENAAAAAAGSGEGVNDNAAREARPSFRVTAYGDLDCDGVLSTFYRGGTAVGYGSVRGDTEAIRVNEAE